MPKKGIIIGFGNMGQLHYDRYLKLDVDVTAIVDTNEAQRKKAKAQGLNAYATIEECQEEAKQADFFDISVPTDLHFHFLELVIKKYHKPIFVEKPAVRTAEETYALERLAETYPYPIFVGEVEHYNPHMRDYLKMSENPSYLKISRMVNLPYFLNERQTWFLDEKRSGGPVLDLMYHDLSCAISVFGEPTLRKVFASQKKYACIDEVTATFDFKNFTAELTASWVSEDTYHPIVTKIEVGRRGKTPLEIVIDDYLLQDKLLNDDAYYLELAAFLQSIDTGKVEHPLCEYLAVVRMANHINNRIKNVNHQSAFAQGTLTAFPSLQRVSKFILVSDSEEKDLLLQYRSR